MMHLTKKISMVAFVIFCMSQKIQSNYTHDRFYGMDLIEYVKNQEDIIATKRHHVNNLFDRYFYTEKYVSDYIPTNNGVVIIYTYRTVRRIHTTDANLAEYQKIKNEFNSYIDNVIEEIKVMVCYGASLEIRDQYGYSVVNYCYTKELYNFLRDLGAPFSLQAWSYFKPEEAIIAGAVATVACVISCALYSIASRS